MDSDPKIFFVTGSSGFLGVAVFAQLRKRFNESKFILLQHSKPVEQSNAEIITGDFTTDSFQSIFPQCEIVIHMAGATHAEKDVYELVNVRGTKNMLHAAKEKGVKHFIYISTTALGDHCGAYGESKKKAEELIKESGIPYTILRPSEMYGRGSTEGISKIISLARKYFILPYITNTSLAPVYIDDAVEAIVCASALPGENKTYILSGQSTFSFREVALLVKKVSRKNYLLIPIPQTLLKIMMPIGTLLRFAVSDQLDRLLCKKDYSIALAQSDLSFVPRSLESGLEELLKNS